MKTVKRVLVVLLIAAAAIAATAATVAATDSELVSFALAGRPGAVPLRDVVPGPQYFDLSVASGDPRPLRLLQLPGLRRALLQHVPALPACASGRRRLHRSPW